MLGGYQGAKGLRSSHAVALRQAELWTSIVFEAASHGSAYRGPGCAVNACNANLASNRGLPTAARETTHDEFAT